LLEAAHFCTFAPPISRSQLKASSAKFFSFNQIKSEDDTRTPEWTILRDRWELSHLIRAIFGMISLVFLTMAISA
jgi:hypothetical protein